MSIKIEVHSIESDGVCSLSGKPGEVLVLTFSDGTITEAPLSQKALMQLLRMKLTQKPKPPARTEPPAKSEPAADINGSALPGTPRPQPVAAATPASTRFPR